VIVYILEIRHGGNFFSGPQDTVAVKYGAIPYELTHPGKHCGIGDRVTPGGELVTSDKGTVACEGKVVQTAEGPTQIRSISGSEPSTWITIFTAMFMHGGFLHIIGNMLFLWIFGNNVEDAMGPLKFLAFYLLSGIAALALQVAFNTDSTVPTIGASGAIAGVLGGYILLYPRARVLTLIFLIFFVTFIEIPAVLVLGLWFLQQLYFGLADLSDPTGGGVAYFAHIGGFIAGLVLAFLLRAIGRGPTRPFATA